MSGPNAFSIRSAISGVSALWRVGGLRERLSAFRPTRFCDEFAVSHRMDCQLRSERKLGRKAEALPHENLCFISSNAPH